MDGDSYWGEESNKEYKNVFAIKKYADGRTYIG
jgi:hypothetical protein